MSINTLTSYADSYSIDAYGRSRVSSEDTVFNSTQTNTFDCQKMFDFGIWDDPNSYIPYQTPGSSFTPSPFVVGAFASGINGSYIGVSPSGIDQDKRMVPLGLSEIYSDAKLIIQSKEYIPLPAGKSGFLKCSGVYAPQTASEPSFKRFVIRSSATGSTIDTVYEQADWNIDKMDGSGPSKVNIAFRNLNTLVADFQNSCGRIRFGFMINGRPIYCHEVQTTNVLPHPIMQTFSLPARIELSNQGGLATCRAGLFDMKNGLFLETKDDFVGGFATVWMKDWSVNVEGGGVAGLFQNDASRLTSVAVGASPTPLVSIRPKTTFNSLENRSILFPTTISVAASGNNPVYVYFNRGGIVSGGTWVGTDNTKSYEINNTVTSITGGHNAGGIAIPPASGNSGTPANAGRLNYKAVNVMSRIDEQLILIKQLTLVAVAPDGPAAIDVCTINNGENYD